MCIRDRHRAAGGRAIAAPGLNAVEMLAARLKAYVLVGGICLLYTSDAADERSSVDLGGRRIIKQKKYISTDVEDEHNKQTGEDRAYL